MTAAPTAFLARTDATTRARRSFWRGLMAGVLIGIVVSAFVLFASAAFVAAG